MKECWSQGDLRAYHDGELLPADSERVAAHLAECPACEALADEVAGRAARVAKWMAALPEPGQVMWMPRPGPRPVRGRGWKPVAAGAAVAAGVALAAWLKPERQPPPAPPAVVKVAPVITPRPPQVLVQAASPVRRPFRRPAPARKVRDVFLALDDEPIETGVIVRVALGEAEIPADVVFGKDGRARAIRLVSNLSSH